MDDDKIGTELQDVINECCLTDHLYIGPVFTWTNHHVFCKLDSVLVNGDLLHMNRESVVQF